MLLAKHLQTEHIIVQQGPSIAPPLFNVSKDLVHCQDVACPIDSSSIGHMTHSISSCATPIIRVTAAGLTAKLSREDGIGVEWTVAERGNCHHNVFLNGCVKFPSFHHLK